MTVATTTQSRNKPLDTETETAWSDIGHSASRALTQPFRVASSPSKSSPLAEPHRDTEALLAVLIEARTLVRAWHEDDPREHASSMLLFVEVVAGKVTPEALRGAVIAHAGHSNRAPTPNDLLAIARASRPEPTERERIAVGEAGVRDDNLRLASTGSTVRWHLSQNGNKEMFIPGGPGEMRACSQNGRVIAPMFKRGPDGKPGEWFVLGDDARILSDAYSDLKAAYRIKGNTIVAVDPNGNVWTHPNDDYRQAAE